MDSMKTTAIKEYLSRIDFRNDNWSIHNMGNDMRRFLGEVPAIDVTYKKDVMVNEFTGEAKEFKEVEKISIVYTDLDDKYKKIEIVI